MGNAAFLTGGFDSAAAEQEFPCGEYEHRSYANPARFGQKGKRRTGYGVEMVGLWTSQGVGDIVVYDATVRAQARFDPWTQSSHDQSGAYAQIVLLLTAFGAALGLIASPAWMCWGAVTGAILAFVLIAVSRPH